MSIKVSRQERETSHALVRRFSRRVRQSGLLRRARRGRFRQRPKSREMKKRAALRREELKKEHEELRKLGKPKKWTSRKKFKKI